jgi:hypothetical protein
MFVYLCDIMFVIDDFIIGLLGIGNFFSDAGFIIKIFALIAILGFVNKQIQSKVIKIIVTVLMVYFILIANWDTFGPIYILYVVLGLGFAGTMVDFFFVAQAGGGSPEGMMGKGGGEAVQKDIVPNNVTGPGFMSGRMGRPGM